MKNYEKRSKKVTFEEAFADVLKLSPEELLNCQIDPFISKVLNLFEENDKVGKFISL